MCEQDSEAAAALVCEQGSEAAAALVVHMYTTGSGVAAAASVYAQQGSEVAAALVVNVHVRLTGLEGSSSKRLHIRMLEGYINISRHGKNLLSCGIEQWIIRRNY